jgi:hypothetical protein
MMTFRKKEIATTHTISDKSNIPVLNLLKRFRTGRINGSVNHNTIPLILKRIGGVDLPENGPTNQLNIARATKAATSTSQKIDMAFTNKPNKVI